MIVSIYIDFALALNFINHMRLISKLADMGVPKILVSWIESYLGHRQICTKLNYCIIVFKTFIMRCCPRSYNWPSVISVLYKSPGNSHA